MVRLGETFTALSALTYSLPGCKGSILLRLEAKVEGRGEMEKKRRREEKGKERELGRRVLWSPKILKIDSDERHYLFKRITYVRQHLAGR